MARPAAIGSSARSNPSKSSVIRIVAVVTIGIVWGGVILRSQKFNDGSACIEELIRLRKETAAAASTTTTPTVLEVNARSSNTTTTNSLRISSQEYSKAQIESGGFFTDISEVHWNLLKERAARQQEQFASPSFAKGTVTNPAAFYQNSYEPDFTCLGERRVGGLGDGPKWVCDPHRIGKAADIQPAAVEQPQQGQGRNNHDGTSSSCLIYSIGSAGKINFEQGVQDEIASGNCEVHVFDIVGYNRRNGNFTEKLATVGASFHPWGIETASNAKRKPHLKTLAETVEILNHSGREIDIFKIDCEGCEWHTYKDWFTSGVTMRQILVEVHGVKVPETFQFFKHLRDAHYHVFHKEANAISRPCADAWEYAFIRLTPAFDR